MHDWESLVTDTWCVTHVCGCMYDDTWWIICHASDIKHHLLCIMYHASFIIIHASSLSALSSSSYTSFSFKTYKYKQLKFYFKYLFFRLMCTSYIIVNLLLNYLLIVTHHNNINVMITWIRLPKPPFGPVAMITEEMTNINNI